ncbi:MAG TPA: cytochrome c [Polyangiaceae bacterium]|nr:cytochrome c [Polyangiaceae bacterium]
MMTPACACPRPPLRALLHLAVAAALAALLGSGCDVDFERMLDQPKAEPFEKSAFFDNGLSMRAPPAGTVPVTRVMGPSELVSGRTAAGEYTTHIPVPLDAALLDRGEDRFRIFCRTCHGTLGDGRSAVAENMKLRKPPSLHEPRLRSYAPGRLYRVVTEGYGLMPSYAESLSIADRWAVVAFVRALQLSQNVPLAELPATLHEEAAPWL